MIFFTIVGSVTCPKTHKYAYKHGEWCCQTNKDCDNNQLKLTSACCQYSAYKECQGRKSGKRCKNHESGNTIPIDISILSCYRNETEI